tara:strand:- start:158 stop:496 length:339 start_codon:yes stop_codon:yes gene_type:complete
MITKFLSKLKSILFKSEPPSVITEAKAPKAKTKKKVVKSSKSSKSSKSKTKKDDPKKIIEAFKAIPGVGAKSAEAFYKAGFKTTKSITSAKDEDLLAVPGVGINLVKKLKNL